MAGECLHACAGRSIKSADLYGLVDTGGCSPSAYGGCVLVPSAWQQFPQEDGWLCGVIT